MKPAAAEQSELRWQVWLAWAAFASILLSATRADPDLWGHVRFGLDWLQSRALPMEDPYSFTQDRPWVNHEWLSEAAMAWTYAVGGTAGLVLLKVSVVACALVVLAIRLNGSTPVVMVSVLSLAIASALPITGTIRPQLWSLLGLALVMPLCDPRSPGLRRTVLAALLFGTWANFHGGWITGGAALGCYAVFRAAQDRRQAFRWAMLGAASLSATLLNPYGIGLWTFLATTVRASRPDVSEWQPFSLREPPVMWLSILVPIAIALYLSRNKNSRPPVETWAVLLLLVAAGLRVSRVAPLMAPATLVLLAPSIRAGFGDRFRLYAPSTATALILGTPVLLAGLAAFTPVARALTCIPINDSWAPDLGAAARLRGLTGKLWTTFDWGEYAIWHFGPSLRVSIDGRRETVYSNQILQWHRGVERGDTEDLAKLAALAPDYVWLRSLAARARDWLSANGYRIDVHSERSFVAVRANLPPLKASAEPLQACFP